MPQKTPGQIAYEAYWRSARYGRVPVAWAKLLPHWQAGWDAAAQAVLDAQEPRTGFILSRDELEHLLNCLANQKFLHEMAEPMRGEVQALIDMAWRKGMDWLAAVEDAP